jgi:cell division protein FtsB
MKSRATRILTNKYLLTFLAFAVWMVFFDNNNLKRQVQLREDLEELYRTRSFYKAEIARNRQAIEELTTNKETLEKFAREKYLMRRDSEDVFIVVYE